MSKRQLGQSAAGVGSPPSKRTKTFGGPSADDKDPLTQQLMAPSSTALSTRTLPLTYVPALTTLCARVFVANIQPLFRQQRDETQEWLKLLPETIIPPLFSMLRKSHPSLLSHPFISTFLLRGDTVVLSGSLPGVSTLTIQAVSKLGPGLRNLQLTELEKITDDVFSKLLPDFPMLQVLVLRGCTKVGKKTLDAAAKTCKSLKVVNLNYTSAPAAAISLLTAECLELEVLKLAGIPNLTDATFGTIMHTSITRSTGQGPLTHLRALKLRHTLISEQSLGSVISLCPLLERLDVSFTPIRQPVIFIERDPVPSIHKLSLTSTPLTTSFLTKLTASKISKPILTSLRTLHMGALGSSPSSSISTLAGSLTLTDQILDLLTDLLADCKNLENINLVGNTKLGINTGKTTALARFIRKVGRRCKVLNLAGISRLRSSDLAGLLPYHERNMDEESQAPSRLQTFALNNTDVGDAASPYIASCAQLTTLELAGTKFGYDSLFQIVDSCPHLTHMDLTSCRGVKVGDRRRFFEVWERDWKDN